MITARIGVAASAAALVAMAIILVGCGAPSQTTGRPSATPGLSATDRAFIHDLDLFRVTYTTPEHAISTAHEICNKFTSGSSRAAVEDFYTPQREWGDPLMLISIAVGQYCPQYLQPGGPERSYPSVTATAAPITPPPGAHHSAVADVWVPGNASLVEGSPESERWELEGTSYQDAVAQEAALIPVGQPLNGHPYCRKTAIPPDSTDNTSWFWGRPREALIVSVFQGFSTGDNAAVVIRHTTEASLFCQ
ncbi:DUF732 domain-containing protein [Mycobacterium sp.]|uniref:DUF732 domain-containing protein n=1 Tax=Mycobacterium sp. TaxID=1785 RepID=UPI003F9BD70F